MVLISAPRRVSALLLLASVTFLNLFICFRHQQITEASATASSKLDAERVLGWGTLFGEIALVTNSPYFHTTIARGKVAGAVPPSSVFSGYTIQNCPNALLLALYIYFPPSLHLSPRSVVAIVCWYSSHSIVELLLFYDFTLLLYLFNSLL